MPRTETRSRGVRARPAPTATGTPDDLRQSLGNDGFSRAFAEPSPEIDTLPRTTPGIDTAAQATPATPATPTAQATPATAQPPVTAPPPASAPAPAPAPVASFGTTGRASGVPAQEAQPAPPAAPPQPTGREALREEPPAQPAAPRQADAGIAAWRERATAASDAIAPPNLDGPAATPGQLAQSAMMCEEQRAAAEPDYSEQVREQMPAAPKAGDEETVLDTTEAEAAVEAVEATGNARLSDQTFPAAERMFPDAGMIPLVSGATIDARIAAIWAPPPVATGLPPAVTVTATKTASLEPLPPLDAAEVGDVVARVLADTPAHAEQFLREAAATLDPSGTVTQLWTVASAFQAGTMLALDNELHAVAAAAGVTRTVLDEKAAAAREHAEEQAEAVAGELGQQAGAAEAGVCRRSADQLARISGARAGADQEAELKHRAATGGTGPSGIESARDLYLDRVNRAAAAAAARLRAAQQNRSADLTRLGEQRNAYYRARTGPDAGAGRDGAEQQNLEVDAVVARLGRDAAGETARLTGIVQAVAATSRDRVRDWAARQEGRERSWWERLFDLFSDWLTASGASTEAWEAQRAAETRDAVTADLGMLREQYEQMAAGNGRAVVDEMARMSEQQRAVIIAFMASGGRDSIGAVAIGLVARLRARRVPELGEQIEKKAIQDLGWEDLDAIGRQQDPAFSARMLIWDVRRAVRGPFTNDPMLFAAISGRTPVQIAAMRKAYRDKFDEDMDDAINSDVVFSEQERVDQLLSGDPVAGAVATIADAIAWPTTDEKTIMRTLRGLTPVQRELVVIAYEKKYEVALTTDLEGDLSGNDLAQALALLGGDVARADAIEINEAMWGPGTQEPEIHAVYTRIRDEVEAKGARRGMTTAQIEAEIKRRTEALRRAYDSQYFDEGLTLDKRFAEDLEGGELELVRGYQAADPVAIDVAKLRVEHESILYADDDKINEVLRGQHERAERELRRDLEIDLNRRSAGLSAEQREAARKHMEDGIPVAAKANMAKLEAAYDRTSFTGAFRLLILFEVQGESRKEATARIASGGKLSDAAELKHAIYGAGTNYATIRRILLGKKKSELEGIVKQYSAITGNGNLAEDLAWDLEGRDEADMVLLLKFGSGTPQEKMAYLNARKEWELTEGVGVDGGGLTASDETRFLIATVEEAQRAFNAYKRLLASGEDDQDPETIAARERFERWAGYGDRDIDERRTSQDVIADTVATIVVVAVGAVATVVTMGTATPVMAAVLGAIAAVASSIAVKRGLKGAAYGGEQFAVDLAQGLAEAVFAAAGAKFVGPALKKLATAKAIVTMTQAAESGWLGRIAVAGAAEALEEAIVGLPSGAAAAILDKQTWASDNKLLVILAAAGAEAGQSAAAGFVTGSGKTPVGMAWKRIRGAAGTPPSSVPPTSVPPTSVPPTSVPPSSTPPPPPPPARSSSSGGAENFEKGASWVHPDLTEGGHALRPGAPTTEYAPSPLQKPSKEGPLEGSEQERLDRIEGERLERLAKYVRSQEGKHNELDPEPWPPRTADSEKPPPLDTEPREVNPAEWWDPGANKSRERTKEQRKAAKKARKAKREGKAYDPNHLDVLPNPTTNMVSGESGPYGSDNLYHGKAQEEATSDLTKRGWIEPGYATGKMRVKEPDHYLGWLEESYQTHAQMPLDPRVRAAVEAYIKQGELESKAPNPHAGEPGQPPESYAGDLPGTHSEVLGVNKAIQRQGATGRIYVSTVRTELGEHIAACAHCSGIFAKLREQNKDLTIVVHTGETNLK
ncbi:hypothetical protein FB565_008264 [Actinoplanes lutulentus]|nr:hypothetical protein [Actinoplanes lutulentus]